MYKDWTERILQDRVTNQEIMELEHSDTLDSNIKLGILYLFTRGPGEAQHRLTSASQQTADAILHDALHHLSGNPYPAQMMLKPGYDRIKLAEQFRQRELIKA